MQQWIIPCNIKLYDVIGAFSNLKCIDWKQSNRSICMKLLLKGNLLFLDSQIPQ